MKIDRDYRFLDYGRILPWLAVGIFGVLLMLVMLIYSSFLVAFFSGIILFIFFRKPHYALVDLIGENRRTLTALISTVLSLLIIVIPVIVVMLSLITELTLAAALVREWFTTENLTEFYLSNRWLDRYINVTEADLNRIWQQLMQYSREAGLMTLKQSGNLFATTAKLLINFIIALFVMFFLFRDADRLPPVIYRNLPFPDEIEAQIGRKMISTLDAVVTGNLLVSILHGLAVGLLFWFFGLSTPILYGALGAFFSLIPVVATSVIWVPAVIYLYMNGFVMQAVSFGLLNLFFFSLLEYLVKPIVLDRKLKLHPFFLFLAILGGITEFGLKGLILGPFIVAMFAAIWQLIYLWNNQYGSE